jgi:hypothetical protein
MLQLDLAIAAQASAAKAVKGTATDALTTLEAAIADFQSTGNANTDWQKFKQAYDQATQQYRSLAAVDAQATKTAKAPAVSASAIPAGLPARLAALLAGKATAANPAPVVAPVVAAAPVAASPGSASAAA